MQEDPASKLPHRVHHATDEEKLASTVMGQKDGPEEFSDCTKTTTCTKTADGEEEVLRTAPSALLAVLQCLCSDNKSIIIRDWGNLSLMRFNKHCSVRLDRQNSYERETDLLPSGKKNGPLFCWHINLPFKQKQSDSPVIFPLHLK